MKTSNFDRSSLLMWLSSPSAFMREVWIQCFGVPLHGWSVKVSEAIGRKFREVVEVSKDTLDKLNMEFGRVCVRTQYFGFIKMVMM